MVSFVTLRLTFPTLSRMLCSCDMCIVIMDEWEITERFLEFKNSYKKTRSEIAGMIESVLMDRGIDISDCRGQGYD